MHIFNYIVSISFIFLLFLPISKNIISIFEFKKDLDFEHNLKKIQFSLGSAFEEWRKVEDILVDKTSFKKLLLHYYGNLHFIFFDRSINHEVVVGEGKTLFYLTRNSGDPYGDFRGLNSFSEANLSLIDFNLRKRNDLFRKRGITFLVVVIPNKESVYGELLESRLGKFSKINRLVQLEEYLSNKKNDTFISLRKKLLDAKSRQKKLYFTYDSHWNDLGALIGIESIIRKLSLNSSLKPIEIGNFDFVELEKESPGDLLRLLGIEKSGLSEVNPHLMNFNPSFIHNAKDVPLMQYNARYLTLEKALPNSVFYCDSFLMYGPRNLLANSFHESYFIWNGMPEDFGKIDFRSIDFFVFEIAERYIEKLLEPVKDEEQPWIF